MFIAFRAFVDVFVAFRVCIVMIVWALSQVALADPPRHRRWLLRTPLAFAGGSCGPPSPKQVALADPSRPRRWLLRILAVLDLAQGRPCTTSVVACGYCEAECIFPHPVKVLLFPRHTRTHSHTLSASHHHHMHGDLRTNVHIPINFPGAHYSYGLPSPRSRSPSVSMIHIYDRAWQAVAGGGKGESYNLPQCFGDEQAACCICLMVTHSLHCETH